MVDLAREWHPAKTIFKYIDVCFMLKIRYLHLHFIDDQAYTLPSRVLPNLTAYNNSYTFEDIESFRAYAKARGIIWNVDLHHNVDDFVLKMNVTLHRIARLINN